MGIYREVKTWIVCDKCGQEIARWSSRGTGVSKEWAKYFAREKGATVGKKGVICKGCRMEKRKNR